MKLDNLRAKELTYKDTFFYVKEVLLLNYKNFLKLLCLWVLFAFLLLYVRKFLSDNFVAFSFILGYMVFYLFYLSFIEQARMAIDKHKENIFISLKNVFTGFMDRKGLDLLELLPAVVVIFLIVFFPSSIFAIPLAFIITLATIVFVAYTIVSQPIVVIKKINMIPAVRYSISLISGYFSFVMGLITSLALACLILYIPCIFIKLSAFWHHFLILTYAGIEVLLFAVMLTIVYINLEVAWSVGFRKYEDEDFTPVNSKDDDHEFTEFFNNVPEIKVNSDSSNDWDDE